MGRLPDRVEKSVRIHALMLATGRRSIAKAAAWIAARDGDFDRLLAVLDPDVVLRADFGPAGGSQELRGPAAVAGQAFGYAQLALDIRPALINGVAGAVAFLHGQPFSGRRRHRPERQIVELDFLTDPERLRLLDLAILDD